MPVLCQLRPVFLYQFGVSRNTVRIVCQHPIEDIPQLHAVDLRIDIQYLISGLSMEDKRLLPGIIIAGYMGLDLLIDTEKVHLELLKDCLQSGRRCGSVHQILLKPSGKLLLRIFIPGPIGVRQIRIVRPEFRFQLLKLSDRFKPCPGCKLLQ